MSDSDYRRKVLMDFMDKHGLKPFPWSKKAGTADNTLRNFLNGKSDTLTATTYQRLAEAAGVPVSELLGENKNLVNDSKLSQPGGVFLKARGAVEAGVWEEAIEWPEEDWFTFLAEEDDLYQLNDRFGLVVRGQSMNKIYPAGTVLDCVKIEGVPHPLESGDHVIVYREHEGKYEATVKEIEFKETGVILWPRSTNPDFSPLIIKNVDSPNRVDSTIIRVSALVIGAYHRKRRKRK